MAKFFRDASGNYGFRKNWEEEQLAPLPANVVELVEFDEETNPPLVDSLSGKSAVRWQGHTIASGQILANGIPLTVAPDGGPKTDKVRFHNNFQEMVSQLQAYLRVADTATPAQLREQTKNMTEYMLRLLRYLKRTIS